MQLPLGYNTLLGKLFEGGVDLSGGEWQKIALARAFMRDAKVLILDEPTASLDAIAEHELYQRFSQLRKGKTTIVVSHRFSTVKMADRIVVLDNGRVLEQGTHMQLLEAKGKYATLYGLQAESYQ